MNVKCCLVTDCKSLYDFLMRRGSTPAEKRLRLDLEILRDQYDDEKGALQFAWVNTKQQLSDPLTKNSVEAFAYLRHVLLTGVFSIKYDANIDKIISSYKHQTSIWAKA